MRFQFIDDHRDEFPVRRMCNELNVSPSGYYAWRKRPASAREMANQELFKKIEAVYNDNHGVYGSPRIYRELKDQGVGLQREPSRPSDASARPASEADPSVSRARPSATRPIQRLPTC